MLGKACQGASTLGAGFTPTIATGLTLLGGLGAVAAFWMAVLARDSWPPA